MKLRGDLDESPVQAIGLFQLNAVIYFSWMCFSGADGVVVLWCDMVCNSLDSHALRLCLNACGLVFLLGHNIRLPLYVVNNGS